MTVILDRGACGKRFGVLFATEFLDGSHSEFSEPGRFPDVFLLERRLHVLCNPEVNIKTCQKKRDMSKKTGIPEHNVSNMCIF